MSISSGLKSLASKGQQLLNAAWLVTSSHLAIGQFSHAIKPATYEQLIKQDLHTTGMSAVFISSQGFGAQSFWIITALGLGLSGSP